MDLKIYNLENEMKKDLLFCTQKNKPIGGLRCVHVTIKYIKKKERADFSGTSEESYF